MKHSGTIREQQTCNTIGRYAQQMNDALDETFDDDTEHGFSICITPDIDDRSNPRKEIFSTEEFYVSESLQIRHGGSRSISFHEDKCSPDSEKVTFHTHPVIDDIIAENFSSSDYAASLIDKSVAMCVGADEHVKCLFIDKGNRKYKAIREKIINEHVKRNINGVQSVLWQKMNDGEDVDKECKILRKHDTYVNKIISNALENGIISQCSVRSNMGIV